MCSSLSFLQDSHLLCSLRSELGPLRPHDPPRAQQRFCGPRHRATSRHAAARDSDGARDARPGACGGGVALARRSGMQQIRAAFVEKVIEVS